MNGSEERVMLSARIPESLKRLVDADQRPNQEIVEAALWDEFGGERVGTLQREIEEERNRVNLLAEEIEARQEELDEREERLNTLEAKAERMESEQTEQREDAISAAVSAFTPSTWLSSSPKREQIPGPENEQMQQFAGEADMDVDAFAAEVTDRILSGETDE